MKKPEIKWVNVVKRNLSLLFYELINCGQTKIGMKKNLGFNFCCDPYRSIEGKVYYTEKNLSDLYNGAKEIYQKKGVNGLKSLLKKWYIFMEDLMKIASDISKKDYSEKTNQELIKELEKLKNGFYKFSNALMMPLSIGKL
ncbi:unnamed protein product, partial [marine sediment metagenome]